MQHILLIRPLLRPTRCLLSVHPVSAQLLQLLLHQEAEACTDVPVAKGRACTRGESLSRRAGFISWHLWCNSFAQVLASPLILWPSIGGSLPTALGIKYSLCSTVSSFSVHCSSSYASWMQFCLLQVAQRARSGLLTGTSPSRAASRTPSRVPSISEEATSPMPFRGEGVHHGGRRGTTMPVASLLEALNEGTEHTEPETFEVFAHHINFVLPALDWLCTLQLLCMTAFFASTLLGYHVGTQGCNNNHQAHVDVLMQWSDLSCTACTAQCLIP